MFRSERPWCRKSARCTSANGDTATVRRNSESGHGNQIPPAHSSLRPWRAFRFQRAKAMRRFRRDSVPCPPKAGPPAPENNPGLHRRPQDRCVWRNAARDRNRRQSGNSDRRRRPFAIIAAARTWLLVRCNSSRIGRRKYRRLWLVVEKE